MPRENVHQLIIEKIEQLQSALFFSETSDRVIPSAVLQQVYTDNNEQVWFAIPQPLYAIDPNHTSFPCRMDFFKKGLNFHVKISGLATITDVSEMHGCPLPLAEVIAANKNHQQMVIKVKIEQADCFEMAPMPSNVKTKNGFEFFSNAFSKIKDQLFSKPLNTGVTAYS